MGVRRPIAVIAWSDTGARARDLAADLSAAPFVVATLGRRGPAAAALGSLVDVARTIAFLALRRPRAVIVQNPPIVPALIAAVYARLTDGILVLDSHAGAFGSKSDGAARRLTGVHRALARRATAVLVPSDALAKTVAGWGGRPLVLFDPPPARPPRVTAPGPRAVYAGLLAPDEPVGALIEAARLTPDVDLVLLGDPTRLPRSLVARAPRNATFGGLQREDAYLASVATAGVVVALTTDPASTLRVACEATYLGRPLVVSDSPASRDAFPHATHVANTPQALADGLHAALARAGDVDAARAHLAERYRAQREALLVVLEARAPSQP